MIYFLTAGEASGDKLAADLMQSIKLRDSDAIFHGIGGELMQAEGLISLLPMERICFLGFTTVFLHIRSIYKIINEVANKINQLKPDRFISIDSPDFAIRVCRRITVPTQKIHYVAPTIWAMRPKRAKIFAQYYDAILTLFPFEPDFFNQYKKCAYFIGHEMFHCIVLQQTQNSTLWWQNFCKDKKLTIKNKPLIALLPGSRISEVKRLMPIFKEVAEKILVTHPDAHFIIASFDKYTDIIKPYIANLPCHLIIDQEKRFSAMKNCDLAIAASGTVSLHLGLLQVPHLITYQVGKFNFLIAKMLLSIKQFNLFNLMAEKKWHLLPENHSDIDAQIIPEHIQEKCNAEEIYQNALKLLDKETAQKQLKTINLLLKHLQPPEKSPHYVAELIDSIFAK